MVNLPTSGTRAPASGGLAGRRRTATATTVAVARTRAGRLPLLTRGRARGGGRRGGGGVVDGLAVAGPAAVAVPVARGTVAGGPLAGVTGGALLARLALDGGGVDDPALGAGGDALVVEEVLGGRVRLLRLVEGQVEGL